MKIKPNIKNLKTYLEKLTVRDVTPNPNWFSYTYRRRMDIPRTGIFFTDLNKFSDLVFGEFVRFNIGGYNGDTYVCKILRNVCKSNEDNEKEEFYGIENESLYFYPCTREQLESIIKYGAILNLKNENVGTNGKKIKLWLDGKPNLKSI